MNVVRKEKIMRMVGLLNAKGYTVDFTRIEDRIDGPQFISKMALWWETVDGIDIVVVYDAQPKVDKVDEFKIINAKYLDKERLAELTEIVAEGNSWYYVEALEREAAEEAERQEWRKEFKRGRKK